MYTFFLIYNIPIRDCVSACDLIVVVYLLSLLVSVHCFCRDGEDYGLVTHVVWKCIHRMVLVLLFDAALN
jgi:hypothetical protein